MLDFQNMAKIYYYICIWAVCLLAACSAGDDATSFPGQADAENRVGGDVAAVCLIFPNFAVFPVFSDQGGLGDGYRSFAWRNDEKLVCGGGTEWNDREDYHFRFEIGCY